MCQRTTHITDARLTMVAQTVRHALVRTCHVETVPPKLPGTVEALLLYKVRQPILQLESDHPPPAINRYMPHWPVERSAKLAKLIHESEETVLAALHVHIHIELIRYPTTQSHTGMTGCARHVRRFSPIANVPHATSNSNIVFRPISTRRSGTP
jgi:hypothetical protein